MRKWGVLITGFYAFILLFVMEPALLFLLDGPVEDWLQLPWWVEDEIWPLYVWALILIMGQALLLFVSVDTSFRRIQRRRQVGVAVAMVAAMVGLLSGMVALSIAAAIFGDEIFPDNETLFGIELMALIVSFWAVWAFIFRRYVVGDSVSVDRLVSWLIKGSILELLIVVPCHVIVRHREDCSAPAVTGYGIATGIAVMLLAFGPSVLFLYQKRLGEYKQRTDRKDS